MSQEKSSEERESEVPSSGVSSTDCADKSGTTRLGLGPAEALNKETMLGVAPPAQESLEVSPDFRADFRTSPGGGRNRISGGRSVAAAYVSPTTLAPDVHQRETTSAVKLDEMVRAEAHSFQTEPSLMRRRASFSPPPLPPEHLRSSRNALYFVLGLGLALMTAAALWFAQERWGVAAEEARKEVAEGEVAGANETTENEVKAEQKVKESRLPKVQQLGAPPKNPQKDTERAVEAAEASSSSTSTPQKKPVPTADTESAEKQSQNEKTRNAQAVGPKQGEKAVSPPSKPTPNSAPASQEKPSSSNELWLE